MEGVHPADGAVGHGGGQEVVGRGVLHSTVELALVLLRYCTGAGGGGAGGAERAGGAKCDTELGRK